MSIVQTGLEGLRRAETSIERTARKLAELPVSVTGEPQDVVDLSAEAVSLLMAKHTFEANLRAIETGTELAQSTLDLMA
jgi:hypothetical protein